MSADEARHRHRPVLVQRCVALLSPALSRPGAVVVDATLGMGGHGEALLEASPGAVLIGIDRDPQALDLAGRRLAGFGERVRLVHAVYDELPEVLGRLGIGAVDGVLLDLGVSSLQLDEPSRGFSYATDSPLDMRMDPASGSTAASTSPPSLKARLNSKKGNAASDRPAISAGCPTPAAGSTS